MTLAPPRLSRARTVVLWGLAVVWFAEMMLSGVRPLTEKWTQFWEYLAPDDPRLYLTYAVLAAAKAALGVLALYALRSRSPFVRSALFIPMALVPPLNVAFPFQAQGFLLRPTLIGATLSVILWQTFFLFRDDATPSSRMPSTAAGSRLTRWQAANYAWFAVNATILTFAAALFLFAPEVGVRLAFPCLSGSGDTYPPGLALLGMVVGTHLTAVATATWIGTVFSRSNATVRLAVATSSTTHTALLCTLPLAQLAREAGTRCATSSLLIYSIPLLLGWLTYGALANRTRLARRSRLEHPIAH